MVLHYYLFVFHHFVNGLFITPARELQVELATQSEGGACERSVENNAQTVGRLPRSSRARVLHAPLAQASRQLQRRGIRASPHPPRRLMWGRVRAARVVARRLNLLERREVSLTQRDANASQERARGARLSQHNLARTTSPKAKWRVRGCPDIRTAPHSPLRSLQDATTTLTR